MSKRKHVEYKLVLPKGYKKQPLPGRNEWVAALRGGKYTQAKGKLCLRNGSKCCLGVVSHLQGRLKNYRDGDNDSVLSGLNPLDGYLDQTGDFPHEVEVVVGDDVCLSLAKCNDAGLTLAQIADIIERVWKNTGPLPKESL